MLQPIKGSTLEYDILHRSFNVINNSRELKTKAKQYDLEKWLAAIYINYIVSL